MSDPIDTRPRKSGSIESLLQGYMSKFTVRESSQLFDLEFPELRKSLQEMICPVCSCRLKESMKGDVYCVSQRHKRITKERFFIRKQVVDKIIK